MIACRSKYGSWGAGAHRRGLTLVELLVSVAITSILMVTIASAMLIATKALPDLDSPAAQIIAASGAMEQLSAELKYATGFTERDSHSVEFTVADRDSDYAAETIRYDWSCVAGASLTRQYNGGSVVDIIEDVRQFDLTYQLATIDETTVLTSVNIALRAGSDATTRVDGGVQILNSPEVTGP